MPRSDSDAIPTAGSAELWVLLLLALLLQACGSSAPTRPEPATPEVAEAEVETETRRTRAERRSARRERTPSAPEDAGQPAEAIPAAATQAYDRAVAAMLAGDDTEAELELEQFVLQYPDFPGPYINLAIIHQRQGQTVQAREALEHALALAPDHAVANNQLGILNRTEGRFEEAEAAYRRAVAADPAYALAHYNLGVLLDLYLRRPAEALEHYERYQELQPEPDETVGRWIIDLRRRVGTPNTAATRAVQEDLS